MVIRRKTRRTGGQKGVDTMPQGREAREQGTRGGRRVEGAVAGLRREGADVRREDE